VDSCSLTVSPRVRLMAGSLKVMEPYKQYCGELIRKSRQIISSAEDAGRDMNPAEEATVHQLIDQAERGMEHSEAVLTAAGGLVHALGPERAATQLLATAFLALAMNGVAQDVACRKLLDALREYEREFKRGVN
jgi:hypothetical protein